MTWYPSAIKKPFTDAGAFVVGYAKKVVFHTTEGSSAAGAFSAYQANGSAPHFTVDQSGAVYQHVAIDRAARGLKNLSGGVETNRGGAIQIEVVGFAASPNWPDAQINGLKPLLRWIEASSGVQPKGPGRDFATHYGQTNLRFTNAEWVSFSGYCGHCHVPENDHWDPGSINLAVLLPAPTQGVPIVKVTAPPVATLMHPAWGTGYIEVTSDGGVFNFGGAPFFGSLGGITLAAPIVTAVATPSGQGYKLTGRDGGDFNFGDAVSAGRVEFTG